MTHTAILTTPHCATYKKYLNKRKNDGIHVTYHSTNSRTIYWAPYRRVGNPWPKLLYIDVAEHLIEGHKVVAEGVDDEAFAEVLMRADVYLWYKSGCKSWCEVDVPVEFRNIFSANRMLAKFMSASINDRRNLDYWKTCFGVGGARVLCGSPRRPDFTSTLEHVFGYEYASRESSLVLYPKCVLFDLGGWNLKTHGSISNMHLDCTAAAYTMACIAAGVEATVRFDAVVNKPNALPGTDFENCHGIPYRVTDTDAEGRVVLADTIAKYGAPGYTIGTLAGSTVYVGNENAIFTHGLNTKLADGLSDYVVNLPILSSSTLGLHDADGVIRNYVGFNADVQSAITFINEMSQGGHLGHIDLSNCAFPAHEEYAERFHYNVNGFLGLYSILSSLEDE